MCAHNIYVHIDHATSSNYACVCYIIQHMIFFNTGFPVILAQFPDTPQFRPAGWFCVAFGVALLLLQLVIFHGECSWYGIQSKCDKKLSSFEIKEMKWRSLICQVFVSILILIAHMGNRIIYLPSFVLLHII